MSKNFIENYNLFVYFKKQYHIFKSSLQNIGVNFQKLQLHLIFIYEIWQLKVMDKIYTLSYQNSLKMDKNQIQKGVLSRPICPQPVYFNKPAPQKQFQRSQTLFDAFCEQSNINSFIPSLQEFGYIFKEFPHSKLACNEGQSARMGPDSHQLRGNQFEENSSEKVEFMIDVYKKATNQKDNASKFNKRSTANDTKNIPKNFGKAIISFIQKNQTTAIRCIRRYNISMQSFIGELKSKKKILHSIRELRSLWLQQDFIYAKPFRELSYYFLRRGGHRYIFGSRVSDFSNHLKYRYRIMKALKSPQTFNSIKI